MEIDYNSHAECGHVSDKKVKIHAIDFYYFSGTGNTLLVVQKMKEIFEKSGVTVNLLRIEQSNPSEIDLSHTIGLGFPVAGQGTYPFVWDFVKGLPDASDTKIFMVDTMMSFSGGIVGPMKKIVQSKGYIPIGAQEIYMPSNFFPKNVVKIDVAAKTQKGVDNAAGFAEAILSDRAVWGRIPIVSDFMSIFSKSSINWQILRRFYPLAVDTEKCIQCGLCSKLCPIGNITMEEYPHFHDSCKICMRCISFCPTEAIYSGKKVFDRHQAVKANELLR